MHRAPATALSLFSIAISSGATAGTDAASLADLPAAQPALEAREFGLADVAARHFERLLESPALTAEQRGAARALLAEECVRAGEAQRGLAQLDRAGIESPFWRAAALAELGHLSDAAALFEACAADAEHPHRVEAALSAAALATEVGDLDRALTILSTPPAGAPELPTPPVLVLAAAEVLLMDGDARTAAETLRSATLPAPLRPAAQAFLADALLRSGDARGASEAVAPLLTPATASRLPLRLHSRAHLLAADAQRQLGNAAAANNALVVLAESTRDPDALLPALDRLAGSGYFATAAGQAALAKWATAADTALARAARLVSADLALKGARGGPATETALKELADADAPDAIADRALELLVKLYLSDPDPVRSRAGLAAVRASADRAAPLARIEFVQATAQYAAGQFAQAAQSFTDSPGGDGERAAAATFNAALSALRAGDDALFESQLALLPEVTGDPLRAELLLERALLKAAQGEPAAEAALEEFITTHAGHDRLAEALLAKASVILLAHPPRPRAAREALAAARAEPLSAAAAEQADYIAFWIEESGGEAARAIELAEAFLTAWPASDRAPEVRMRIAEIHFREGDYVAARAQFERVANDFPESEYADEALLFAGRVAVLTKTREGTEKALALWQELVVRGSPLTPLARRNQAQVRLRGQRHDLAIQLLDDVIDATPPPAPDLLVSCLLLKGEALYVLSKDDPESATLAIETLRAARETPGASTAAIAESLFREGKAFEALGEMTSALNCFHEVVAAPRKPLEPGETPEFRFFYAAGFECIRLLEERGRPVDIDAAIAIADKLAATSGPRSDDARKYAQRLRLEHFRWE